MPNRKLTYASIALSVIVLIIAFILIGLQVSTAGTAGPAGEPGKPGSIQPQPNMLSLNVSELDDPRLFLVSPFEIIKNTKLLMVTGSFTMVATSDFTITTDVPLKLFNLANVNMKPKGQEISPLGVIFNPLLPTVRHVVKFDLSQTPNCLFQIEGSTLSVHANDVFLCQMFYF
jgi:hypothetical protein